MYSHRLADDQFMFDQHLDLLMEAGISDLIGLTEIQPDLFTRAQCTEGEPLLKPEKIPLWQQWEDSFFSQTRGIHAGVVCTLIRRFNLDGYMVIFWLFLH